jgi:tetratricopeptide (TPR) repeat protein
MALCLENQGQLPEAELHAITAVRSWPDDPFCHYARASVVKARGRPRQAAESATEALRLEPRYVGAWHLLGQIRIDQRDWKAAIACADEGLAVDPDHEGCATVRAAALLEIGAYAQADDTIQRLLGRHPESAAAHALRGWYLLDRSDPRAAMEAFRESLRISPTFHSPQRGLNEARAALNPLVRWYRAWERPIYKWAQRLPRDVRWVSALGYALLYLVGVWLGLTLFLFIPMLLMVLLASL